MDILVVEQSGTSFLEQVQELGLSADLEKKCMDAELFLKTEDTYGKHLYLTGENEKELATEVLLMRHRFTELVASNVVFRQAALTIIQNIYLCKERKIFFSTSRGSTEQERQEALRLFSQPLHQVSIPLEKTLQHLILARIWARILYKADHECLQSAAFKELERVVMALNTLRNIYMLLTIRLVSKITSRINSTYSQSITSEDASQIGTFGVARAAYRYHPSFGVRFSTYASRWILKEIQRQALHSRLIRISTSLVEKISRANRSGDGQQEKEALHTLARATVALGDHPDFLDQYTSDDPAHSTEQKQMSEKMYAAIDMVLTPKSADIIKRRYGIGPYHGQPQSIIQISDVYGVTRGSIYQLEKKALATLAVQLSDGKMKTKKNRSAVA
ncbi:sigma-70 family RNA polymerase sigma factor [Desulfogranum japonicum]|uniref:sigma-70 family RNA polymerase sigma factor n=1 Tax=Desulfogranum japonicum TaxID=231447 RepID=UPI001377C206|nr:sigma-70 family RNA polymerase sigma factor [Desulfogranum japonicum]